MKNKPALSFWQIWNMSFGFLGIQFGWGLQMANMSAIYSYLGARPGQIAYYGLPPCHRSSYSATDRPGQRQDLDTPGAPAAIYPGRGHPRLTCF